MSKETITLKSSTEGDPKPVIQMAGPYLVITCTDNSITFNIHKADTEKDWLPAGTATANDEPATQDVGNETQESPQEIEINGVTYRRKDTSKADEVISEIKALQRISESTGITLEQAVWFAYADLTHYNPPFPPSR